MPDDPPPESPSAESPSAAAPRPVQVPQSSWPQSTPPDPTPPDPTPPDPTPPQSFPQSLPQSFPQPFPPSFPQSARQDDPFRSVWSMSPVADARAGGRARRSRGNLRLGAGLVGGLVTFAPFGLIATILWGWWAGEASWGSGGWIAVLIGAAAGFAIGGVVASQD